jgi:hypothetical protein
MTPVHVINESVPGDQLRIGHGTVGAVEAKLDAIDWPLRKWVVVHAAAGNGGTVTVGRPGDAANGWVLAAGESTPPIPVDNTSFLKVIGSAPAQAYNWFGI